MFSLAHIIWLLISAAMIAGLLILLKRFCRGREKTFLKIAFFVMLLLELVKMFYFIEDVGGGKYYLPARHLPLNLCSIQIWIMAYLAFGKEGKVKNALYSFFFPTGAGGALMALMIPTTMVSEGALSIAAIEYFLFHIVLFTMAIYIVMSGLYRPNIKGYLTSYGVLALFFIFAIYVNGLLGAESGANFFFLVSGPMQGLPILNTNYGWYAYIAQLVAAAVILITAAYSYWLIKEMRKYAALKKQAKLDCGSEQAKTDKNQSDKENK